MTMSHDVFLAWTDPSYGEPPFGGREGPVERALDGLFEVAGLDPANPFADCVGRGGRVVLKPNWVLHANLDGGPIDSLVTHASVVAGVADRAARALEGEGEVVIGDAPLQSCDFDAMLRDSGTTEAVDAVRRRWPGVDFVVEDWRLTLLEDVAEHGGGRAVNASQRSRDDYDAAVDQRYRLVDRGADSFLEDTADYADRYRVTCYKPSLMSAHHAPGRHEYLVTRRIFEADLFVNLPKMKTHMKAGLTGALKNLVGINGHKEYLPHHIKGAYFDGGDCYSESDRFRRVHDELYDYVWEHQRELPAARRRPLDWLMRAFWKLSRVTGDSIAEAGWSGNETIWRTTLDLNHVLFFGDESPRHLISIADGIVAGEGEGPLRPRSKPAGLLMLGRNPAYVDAVMARLMGYNVSRIPTVFHAIYDRRSRFAGPFLADWAVTARSASGDRRRVPFSDLPNLGFLKPRHWHRAEAGDAPEAAGRRAA
jgi:uncharacterized protein (DUF362 family)